MLNRHVDDSSFGQTSSVKWILSLVFASFFSNCFWVQASCFLLCLVFPCSFWFWQWEAHVPFIPCGCNEKWWPAWVRTVLSPWALRSHCTAPVGIWAVQQVKRVVWFPAKARKWIDYSCISLAAFGTSSEPHHHDLRDVGYREMRTVKGERIAFRSHFCAVHLGHRNVTSLLELEVFIFIKLSV